MKMLERVLIIEVLIGLGFKVMSLSGGNELLLIGMTLLSCLYFYLAFALLLGIPLRGIFRKASYQGLKTIRILGVIAAGIVFGIVLIGVLFKLLSLTGGTEMLLVGDTQLVMVLVVAVIAFLTGRKETDNFYKNFFIRAVAIFVVGVFCLLTPSSSFIRFFHRHEPEYAEVLIKAKEHPEDPVAQHELEEASRHRGYAH